MIDRSHAQPLGDTAVVVRLAASPPAAAAARAAALAAAIRRHAPPGIIDVVPALDTVTVFFAEPRMAGHETYIDLLERIVETVPLEAEAAVGTLHEIPVAYGGDDSPDFDAVCTRHHLERAEFIDLHTRPDYVVEAIGFTPGFPYLGGLPAELSTPRRETPRPLVPAGSVGIGGGQTGIYSCPTPGGWHIVGRTDVRLFDADREPPSLLRTGDRVRFVERAVAKQSEPCVAKRIPATQAGPWVGPALRIGRPGLMTTIQDLGRPGHRASGVPLGGAADPLSLRLANLIVGNDETAAGLECTLVGPELTFECDAVVALCGADFSGLPRSRPISVAAGETISLGHARHGCRGALAIAGGIQTQPCLGSRSTYVPALLGGLTGELLREGDRIPIDAVAPLVCGSWSVSPDLTPLASAESGICTLRYIPHAAADHGTSLAGTTWRTSSRSDRMGVRLEGSSCVNGRGDRTSAAVVPGTVQLPPDGQPIILLADAQTIGGYDVAGHVITADLRLAAQLRPGDRVTFTAVTLATAHEALGEQEAAVDALRQTLAGRVCHRDARRTPA
jgi:KipI family sensor histidine kinase inhibitor